MNRYGEVGGEYSPGLVPHENLNFRVYVDGRDVTDACYRFAERRGIAECYYPDETVRFFCHYPAGRDNDPVVWTVPLHGQVRAVMDGEPEPEWRPTNQYVKDVFCRLKRLPK